MSDPTVAVTLRPARLEDRDFLRSVYSSSRADEMAMVDWPDEEKARFLEQQFSAQDTYYRENYPGAEYLVIESANLPAGRWYVCRLPGEIRIMDVALLPEFRGRGIGTALIRKAMDEARASSLKVGLHVEFYNPAQRLYSRLGFMPVGEVGVYIRMEWTPRVS